ncbi:MAG: lipid-A-disaccharide synthase N-terminal domain-containing protein [Tannerellaceae bacterium]|nr:lipid-A-disaccharide synthase N-terminal domain-containing protein [Tannerellaceae bacterium]
MSDSWFYLLIGLLAQLFFSARMFIQWIRSERSGYVVSPLIYWQLSLVGSILFFLYGWFRNDFAILTGQFLSYYVYIWNLDAKGFWKRIHLIIRVFLLLFPCIILTGLLVKGAGLYEKLFTDLSPGLILFGCTGQVLFTLRFLYQWWYSRRKKESLLPVTFWIMSILGASLIFIYGLIRHDLVLIIGQSAGLFTYGRNVWIIKKQRHAYINHGSRGLHRFPSGKKTP